jgi:hypothetical protein
VILVFATPEEGRVLLGLSTRQPESGPCMHYGPYGCEVPREDGQCPHLDNASIVCPIKDACYAMHEVARMRDECEQEQGEQDADMAAGEAVYETETPEFVEPEPDGDHAYAIQLPTPAKRKNAWTEDENWIVARADTWKEAIVSYRGRFPHSKRTDKAIRSRWEKLHTECRAPLTPDFTGDQVPVTQCDEDPVFAVPRPAYRPGDRVRIKHALHRGQTGKIERYFPATENYLVAIDGLPDRIILRDKDLEVEA